MKKPILLFLAVSFLFACKKDNNNNNNSTGRHTNTTFTIPASDIVLNPTGYAPLSAVVHFKSPISGHTEIIVKGKNGAASDIEQSFTDNGTSHSIPVLGLYSAYTNTVQINVIDSKQDTAKSVVTIKTGPLPVNIPDYIHVDVADRANMEPGLNLVSSFSGLPNPPQTPYMIDSFGDIRWYLDYTKSPVLGQLSYDCGINRLADGNFRFGDISSDKIYEVDMMGKIINKWSLGGYIFHHDIYEMPNGDFLVTVTDPNGKHTNGSPTIEDNVIQIDRTSGAIIRRWDLKVSLNEYRTTLTTNSNDWIHENGLLYDADDNTIILSGRTQGVVKLTMDNQVKWIMGPHRGWGKNRRGVDLNKYLLTPLDANGNAITDTSVLNGWTDAADFEWNWFQHSPQLNPNGDLMVFDNGTTRNYNNNPSVYYSRGVEFKIDEKNMTVQQVWEYGKERGAETFSAIVSSVKYIPDDNHVLFCPGYQVANTTGLGGKIIEVDYATHQVVFQMSISSANGWGWHRVQRMPIYPNGQPYPY